MIKQRFRNLWDWFTGKTYDEKVEQMKHSIRKYWLGDGTVNPGEKN